jgi:hypothetical protein
MGEALRNLPGVFRGIITCKTAALRPAATETAGDFPDTFFTLLRRIFTHN